MEPHGVLDTRWSLSSGSPKARPVGGYDGEVNAAPNPAPPQSGSFDFKHRKAVPVRLAAH